jgi:hypothetical protein
MPRKEFEAFTRLDASDVNTFLMDQTVMSFAGTAARGSAIPTPVEGMTTYRQDIDRLESYTDSQWTSPSDLVLIKTQTVGSAVSTVTITDAFSATYDNYLINITGGSTSGTNDIQMRFGSTSTGYYYGGYVNFYTGSFIGDNGSNTALVARVARGSSNGATGIVEIQNPFIEKVTSFQYRSAGLETNSFSFHGSGYVNNTLSYTAFTLIPSTGTMTGQQISVFGYRKTI